MHIQFGLARKVDRLGADWVCVEHLEFSGVCRYRIRRAGARKLVEKVADDEGRAGTGQLDDTGVGGFVRDPTVVVVIYIAQSA